MEETSDTEGSIFDCGDFNARTGTLDDNVETFIGSDGPLVEILGNNKSVQQIPITKIYTRDTQTNEYGKHLPDFCKCAGFRIMNGRLGNYQNSGEFTCYKSNGGASVFDYLICRPQEMVQNLVFHEKIPQSDHTPLAFCITMIKIPNQHNQNEGCNIVKYKWNQHKIDQYHANLNSCENFLENLAGLAADGFVRLRVESISLELDKYMNSVLNMTFTKSSNKSNNFPRNNWFYKECQKKKRLVHDYSKTHDLNIEQHAITYRTLEKEYQWVTQKA